MKPIALLELIRPLNCVMAAFGVLIGYVIAYSSGHSPYFFGISVLPAMIVAFLVCAAGQAINDVFDSEIDARKSKNKPIPGGRISKQSAFLYSIVLFAIGNIIALFLPMQSFLVSIAFSAILVIYSAKMQKSKFIGNWVVALGTAFTLIFGASLIGKYEVVFALACSAMLANVAREIIKDTEDLGIDKGFKVSLPMLAGMEITRRFVFVLYIAAIALAVLAGTVLLFGNFLFLFFVAVSGGFFLFSWLKFAGGFAEKAQKYSKIGMLIALIGFFVGAL